MDTSQTCSQGLSSSRVRHFYCFTEDIVNGCGHVLDGSVRWWSRWCLVWLVLRLWRVLPHEQIYPRLPCVTIADVLRKRQMTSSIITENNFELAGHWKGSRWPQESTDHTLNEGLLQQRRGSENACSGFSGPPLRDSLTWVKPWRKSAFWAQRSCGGWGSGLAGGRRMSNSGFLEGKVQMGEMERIRLDWWARARSQRVSCARRGRWWGAVGQGRGPEPADGPTEEWYSRGPGWDGVEGWCCGGRAVPVLLSTRALTSGGVTVLPQHRVFCILSLISHQTHKWSHLIKISSNVWMNESRISEWQGLSFKKEKNLQSLVFPILTLFFNKMLMLTLYIKCGLFQVLKIGLAAGKGIMALFRRLNLWCFKEIWLWEFFPWSW